MKSLSHGELISSKIQKIYVTHHETKNLRGSKGLQSACPVVVDYSEIFIQINKYNI